MVLGCLLADNRYHRAGTGADRSVRLEDGLLPGAHCPGYHRAGNYLGDSGSCGLGGIKRENGILKKV